MPAHVSSWCNSPPNLLGICVQVSLIKPLAAADICIPFVCNVLKCVLVLVIVFILLLLLLPLMPGCSHLPGDFYAAEDLLVVVACCCLVASLLHLGSALAVVYIFWVLAALIEITFDPLQSACAAAAQCTR